MLCLEDGGGSGRKDKQDMLCGWANWQQDEEQFMHNWRKYGPIGVLFDIIASICTLQTRQLLQCLQQEQADALREPVKLKDLVKPVKTRWNSYYAAFARAVELQGPLDSYVELKIDENCHAEVTARCARRPNACEPVVSILSSCSSNC
jgi:hypothetical protein